MICALIFIFGLMVGSFLNVVILRYNSGESFINSRSQCFSCQKELSWYELIPIFSFIFQKGKCRDCGGKISWQYPVVEIITGLLFLLIFNFQFSIFNIIFYWILASLLIVISVYDLRHLIIPNKIVWLFNILALVFLLVTSYWLPVTNFLNYFFSGLLFFTFFALLWLVSNGKWMGFGDAKLALGIGWFLGPIKVFSAFLFSFWLGAIFSIFLMIFRGNKYSIKSKIPFGPFLAIGALIALFVDINFFSFLFL